MAEPVFGSLGRKTRRVIRAPVNPMDKCTVVSIYPRTIDEVKPTIQPGRFHIDAGSYEEPAILVVSTSSWWKETDPEQPLLEIPQQSIQVADSIVRDWANGLFQCNMGDTMPGLFYVPGDRNTDEIRVIKNKNDVLLLDDAQAKQKRWYGALVEAADTLWVRSNGSPRSISDDMRLAAQDLGLTNKPWLADFATLQLEKCPACGQLRDAEFPVCQHCKTIVNQDQYDRMKLSAAS